MDTKKAVIRIEVNEIIGNEEVTGGMVICSVYVVDENGNITEVAGKGVTLKEGDTLSIKSDSFNLVSV